MGQRWNATVIVVDHKLEGEGNEKGETMYNKEKKVVRDEEVRQGWGRGTWGLMWVTCVSPWTRRGEVMAGGWQDCELRNTVTAISWLHGDGYEGCAGGGVAASS